ncbi:MAG: glutamate--tRNA ligase [Nitrospinota bacterium]
MDKIRVRFAPSPTGYLHVGGFRTALFNYLFARRNKGTFILRIEDTDQTRSTDESIEQIIEGLRWVGLDWDEGPIRQTKRNDIYMETIERLLSEGKAYRCICTADELAQRRRDAKIKGLKPKYDGRCSNLDGNIAKEKPHVVRFRAPAGGSTNFTDLIRGEVSVDNSELDDLIILRSDGTPTYNFCVVIDDASMELTHVIRGDDHISNTPRQIQIYKALGYKVPLFAHLPMILGADKTRLSKRHGATSILEYKKMGYLPDGMLNYFARLGWSHGDQEIFSKEELIDLFSLDHVSKAAAIFDPEKLLWVNGQHIKNCCPESLTKNIRPFLGEKSKAVKDECLKEGLKPLQDRAKTLLEMAEAARFFTEDTVEYDEKAVSKFLTKKTGPYILQLVQLLKEETNTDHDSLEKLFNKIVADHETKFGKVAQPVRVALTGSTKSPSIFDVIHILGKERTLQRLDAGLGLISK